MGRGGEGEEGKGVCVFSVVCMEVYVLVVCDFDCIHGLDDYYDTEDPSVNLHEFIVNSLQAQKWVTTCNTHIHTPLWQFICTLLMQFYRNRVVLLKLEEEFLTYVTDPKRYSVCVSMLFW